MITPRAAWRTHEGGASLLAPPSAASSAELIHRRAPPARARAARTPGTLDDALPEHGERGEQRVELVQRVGAGFLGVHVEVEVHPDAERSRASTASTCSTRVAAYHWTRSWRC